jgi:inosine/xanthosine triphosphate pyrophosphatase family protein
MVYAGRVCRQLLMALGLPDDTDLLMEALQGRPGLSST